MDKSWILLDDFKYPRYMTGFESFLMFAMEKTGRTVLPCPCRRCGFVAKDIDTVAIAAHLFKWGFTKTYNKWVLHGETLSQQRTVPKPVQQVSEVQDHRMDDMVNEAFGIHNNDGVAEAPGTVSSAGATPSTRTWTRSRVPKKVMQWFPLIPRLKRLFMCKETSEEMRWHEEERVKDGVLRHPTDSLAWKDLNTRYPEFESDC